MLSPGVSLVAGCGTASTKSFRHSVIFIIAAPGPVCKDGLIHQYRRLQEMRSWILALLFMAANSALAQSSVIPVWPDGVPNARPQAGPERVDGERINNVSQPTLAVYPAALDRPTGTAVIICPGGGYQFLSNTREGQQYAQWLSALGITAFVLKYRLADYGHPAPLQDVLHAIRLVRS